MIAQKESPLAAVGDRRRLRHDVGNGQAILLAKRHVDARHQGEMEGHVALVALAEVGAHVGRPLVGFRQDQSICVLGIDGGPNSLDDGMGLRQVFAGSSVALDKIGNRIHPQRVDAHVEPEAHRLQHFLNDERVIEVEIGLVREKAMPVIGSCRFVPGPVRFFRVRKNDACVLIHLIALRPDIHLAFRRSGGRQSRGLEPWMLIASVIDDQLDHDLHPARVGGFEEGLEILQRAIRGIDVDIVRNVIPVVAQRGWKERQEPNASDA